MKVHVLAEQATNPALHLLAAHADLIPVTIDEIRQLALQYPLVILGTAKAKLERLCQSIYKGAFPLLLLPPWAAQADLTSVLETPAHLVIQHGRGDKIKLLDSELFQATGQDTAQVRCDQVLITPLQAGIMARNDSGKPVLLRYRPTSTATPIYVTTVQLLAYSSRSDALEREKLLRALLNLLSTTASVHVEVEQPKKEQPTPATSEIRAVVVALSLVQSTSIYQLQKILAERLYTELSAEQIGMILQHLSQAGVVSIIDSEYQVNRVELEQWISRLGLRAYVRELKRA